MIRLELLKPLLAEKIHEYNEWLHAAPGHPSQKAALDPVILQDTCVGSPNRESGSSPHRALEQSAWQAWQESTSIFMCNENVLMPASRINVKLKKFLSRLNVIAWPFRQACKSNHLVVFTGQWTPTELMSQVADFSYLVSNNDFLGMYFAPRKVLLSPIHLSISIVIISPDPESESSPRAESR